MEAVEDVLFAGFDADSSGDVPRATGIAEVIPTQAFPFPTPALVVAAGDSKTPEGFDLDFELVLPAMAGLRLKAQAGHYESAVMLSYPPALYEFL